jgi:DnaJ-class molecular chaperone with C-terminal Zn finger domain
MRGGGPNAGGFAGAQGFGGFADVFGDIFGDIFGGQRAGGRSNVYRGADLRYAMEITLEQAAAGYASEIRVPGWENCDVCHGSGARPGTKPKTCHSCGGQGSVRVQQGFFSIQQTCPTCRGSGQVIPDPCTACDGVGRVKKSKTLEVKIPGRHRRRDAHPLERQRRAGDQRRASGRSLRRDPREGARRLQA